MIRKHLESLVRPRLSFFPSVGGETVRISWEEWFRRAELTGKINYGCGFDDEGKCKKHRGVGIVNATNCCTSCAGARGYYNQMGISEEHVDVLVPLYDERTGFWRKGEGCIVPRKYRSLVCLRHHCIARNSYPSRKIAALIDQGIDLPVEERKIIVNHVTANLELKGFKCSKCESWMVETTCRHKSSDNTVSISITCNDCNHHEVEKYSISAKLKKIKEK